MSNSNSYGRHILILGIIIVIAGIITNSDGLYMKSEEVMLASETIIARFPLLGMLLFVLLAMVSAMLAFFSSAILVPIGIYTWGSITCFVLLWIGWLLGGATAFCIGRFLGRPVASMLVGETRISRLEKQLGQHGRFIHVLLFQASLPSEVPGYVLGTLRYRSSSFLLALAIVELPYALGTVYLGAKFIERDIFLLLLVGFIGVIICALAYHFYRRSSNSVRTGK